MQPEPAYQPLPHAQQHHHHQPFAQQSYQQSSPVTVNYNTNHVVPAPTSSADYRYMSDPQTPRPPTAALTHTESSESFHMHDGAQQHYYQQVPVHERHYQQQQQQLQQHHPHPHHRDPSIEYQVPEHYPERTHIQQQHPQPHLHNQWPTSFHEQPVFPPYATPPPVHSQQQQAEQYDQAYEADDYMQPSASSDGGIWKEQQDLYSKMVQQLHRA
jgi:hypothetical protein